MARKHRKLKSTGRTILLTDDDAEYRAATTRLLEAEGHTVLTAASGDEALGILQSRSVDLLLLDYRMPRMAGEEVVSRLRQFDNRLQVILQTGYASEQPPREMLQRLDIQGYHDKSEGPDKLLLWVDTGLKAAATLAAVQRHRHSQEWILRATPRLHRPQPLTDLYGLVLEVMLGLVEDLGAPDETGPWRALLIELHEDAELRVAGARGFEVAQSFSEQLPEAVIALIKAALEDGEARTWQTESGEQETALPLCVGELALGAVYLVGEEMETDAIHALELLANQAATAMRNTQLFEMAALDPLTGVQARRFFEQWLLREMKSAFRGRQPLSLLMLDLDKMKVINDTLGHLAGDEALATFGRILRSSVRDNDIVARYGGDEFAVILPRSDAEGAVQVAERVLERCSSESVGDADADLPLRCSIGASTIEAHRFDFGNLPRPVPVEYFEKNAQSLIAKADAALYRAKRQARGSLVVGDATHFH